MAVLCLTQQGKVEAALLHIIIAQENQAAVELARKRGNRFQGCTQCVFLTKATLEVDTAGSQEGPCAGRGTDVAVPGW